MTLAGTKKRHLPDYLHDSPWLYEILKNLCVLPGPVFLRDKGVLLPRRLAHRGVLLRAERCGRCDSPGAWRQACLRRRTSPASATPLRPACLQPSVLMHDPFQQEPRGKYLAKAGAQFFVHGFLSECLSHPARVQRHFSPNWYCPVNKVKRISVGQRRYSGIPSFLFCVIPSAERSEESNF